MQTVKVTEDNIQRIAEFNTGMGANVGRFRTAFVLKHPEIIRLARLHQLLANNHVYEVEIFDCLEDGFAWLACANPDPVNIKT